MKKIFFIITFICGSPAYIKTSEQSRNEAFKTLNLAIDSSWFKAKERYAETMTSESHICIKTKSDITKIHTAFIILREYFDPLKPTKSSLQKSIEQTTSPTPPENSKGNFSEVSQLLSIGRMDNDELKKLTKTKRKRGIYGIIPLKDTDL